MKTESEQPVEEPQPQPNPDLPADPPAEKPETYTVDQMENIILGNDFDKTDCNLSQFQKLKLRIRTKKKGTKYSVELTWKKIKGADGYIIYGAKCGNKMKKITTIRKGDTTKWVQKNRKKGTYYKYLVVAYKGNDVITASKAVHATTPDGKKGNPVGITNVKKTKVTLKDGKKYQLKAKVKTNRPYAVHVAELRYESANTDIATVNKKGMISAKKAGVTNVYIYTQNGISKTIKVTVQ